LVVFENRKKSKGAIIIYLYDNAFVYVYTCILSIWTGTSCFKDYLPITRYPLYVYKSTLKLMS